MIFLRNYFIGTTDQVDIKSIIHEVNRTLRESGAKDGLIVISVPEHGAGLAICEGVKELTDSLKDTVIGLAGGGKTKNRRKEDLDIGSRIYSNILGRTLSLPIREGRVQIGHREEVFLMDFTDTALRREFLIQIHFDDAGKAQGGVPPQGRQVA